MKTGFIYLLHFDRALHHAQHYLGFCLDVDKRTTAHLNGTSNARLPGVFINEHGIGFTVARIWTGDRHLERQLKNQKNARRLCPICKK